MKLFKFPHEWNEAAWLNGRRNLVEDMTGEERVVLDLSACTWMDFEPLVDLALYCGDRLKRKRELTIQLADTSAANTSRVTKFLKDSSFLEAISGVSKFASFARLRHLQSSTIPSSDSCRVIVDATELSVAEAVQYLEQCPLPEPYFDSEVILPITIIDANLFNAGGDHSIGRQEIFEFCQEMRLLLLSEPRVTAMRIPYPIASELNVLVTSVFPELLDNVRVHKMDPELRLFAMSARFRRRREHSLGYYHSAEPCADLTPFQKRTSRYFSQADVVEFGMSDQGAGIQDTLMASGAKVKAAYSGVNGDYHILHDVFTKQLSRMPADERNKLGLPAVLTGLQTVAKTIEPGEWAFYVRSGRNCIAVSGRPPLNTPAMGTEDPVEKHFAPLGRLTESPGVQYFFRLSAFAGSPLEGWRNAIRNTQQLDDEHWWDGSYPKRFENVHIVDGLSGALLGDPNTIVVCRPSLGTDKNSLLDFIQRVRANRQRPIFADIPVPVALRIYDLLDDALPHEVRSLVPVICDDMSFKIAGAPKHLEAELEDSFAGIPASQCRPWWEHQVSPIHNIRELFLAIRRYDSKTVWHRICATRGAFLREPVKWSDQKVLRGGFLSVGTALKDPEVREICTRRVGSLLQILRAQNFVYLSDSLHQLGVTVRRRTQLDSGRNGPLVVLGCAHVTGATFDKTKILNLGESVIDLPLFAYPHALVEGMPVEELAEAVPRVFDWLQESDDEVGPYPPYLGEPELSRRGESESVRRKPDNFDIRSKQRPGQMYDAMQRNRLLRLGHFSYGKNHFFAYLDLAKFLADRGSDSQEMISSMAEQLRKWKPDMVFYVPHEVSQMLVDALCVEMPQIGDESGLVDLIQPLSDIQGVAMALSVRSDPKKSPHKLPAEGMSAVVIDDAAVSGDTLRQATHNLSRLGFHPINTMVIVDRCVPYVPGDFDKPESTPTEPRPSSPPSSTQRHQHFAWWEQRLPMLGTEDGCLICRGLAAIESVVGRSMSESGVRDVLTHWHMTWARRQGIDKLNASLPAVPLSRTLNKRVVDPVHLRQSEAVVAHAFDVIERDHRFEYIFEAKGHDFDEARTEVLAGCVVHYFTRWRESLRIRAVKELVEACWKDSRAEARALVAVTLLALDRKYLRVALREYERVLSVEGFQSLDIAVMGWSLVVQSENDPTKVETRLRRWRAMLPGRFSLLERDWNVSIHQAILLAERHSTNATTTIDLLGLPTRGLQHVPLVWLLDEICQAESPDHPPKAQHILLVKSALAKLEALVESDPSLVSSEQVVELRSAISDFRNVTGSLSFEPGVNNDYALTAKLGNAAFRIYNKLFGDAESVRTIILRQKIHYLPRVVMDVIPYVVASVAERDPGTRLSSGDYCYNLDELQPDIDTIRENQDIFALLDRFRKLDVVECDRFALESILRNCLLEAQHSKDYLAEQKLEGRCACTIRSSTEFSEDRLTEYLILHFDTYASDEDFKRAVSGHTWRGLVPMLKNLGLEASMMHDAQTHKLTRRIRFTLLPRDVVLPSD